MSKKTPTEKTRKKEQTTPSESKEETTTTTPPVELNEEQLPPTPTQPEPLTMENLKKEIDILAQVALQHADQIAALQEVFARKRRPVKSNGKIQILDKHTGQIYPSKNNAYQSLLKANELKELVDKGVFGEDPARNTFGWYALEREWPDRFEEVKPEKAETDGKP